MDINGLIFGRSVYFHIDVCLSSFCFDRGLIFGAFATIDQDKLIFTNKEKVYQLWNLNRLLSSKKASLKIFKVL